MKSLIELLMSAALAGNLSMLHALQSSRDSRGTKWRRPGTPGAFGRAKARPVISVPVTLRYALTLAR